METLKFMTAGSVDDGKSTLIGRLLYDSRNIPEDQLSALLKSPDGNPDLALLTDGLRAERAQGITIDVAYRYFSTDKRKFVVVDAPGHVQYTRNMITGASNVELVVLLVDARYGITEQTRRHSVIASLLGIRRVVVAVNKMDLVNYAGNVFDAIVTSFEAIAERLGLQADYIPLCALSGANVITPSSNMPCYKGPALLPFLEQVVVGPGSANDALRFQVQFVIRPQSAAQPDFRGYAGTVQSGRITKGDRLKILPGGVACTVKRIELGGAELDGAGPGRAITLLVEEQVDLQRGDTLVRADDDYTATQEPEVLLCGLNENPLLPGHTYILQTGSRSVRARIARLHYRLDIGTLEKTAVLNEVRMNEVAGARLRTAAPVLADPFRESSVTGRGILVDETSLQTVAAVLFQ